MAGARIGREPSLRLALFAFLVAAASLALTRAFACAMPFAAVATVAALTLPRRFAAALVLVVWASNQAIGFGLMHYPHTASTVAWGFAIAIGALAGLAAASAVIGRLALTTSPRPPSRSPPP